jgi:hypothetical protein
MKITLHHVKNVDLMYGQGNGTGYWDYPADPSRMTVEIKTLKEASVIFSKWRDRNGLGCGNMAIDCGVIKDKGKKIATISYNGRVWDMKGKEIKV